MRRAMPILLGLFLASACSGKTTYKDVCKGIAEAACDKKEECDPPAPSDCVGGSVTICCGVFDDCDAEVMIEGFEEAFDQCIAGYEDLSCAAFNAGQIPPTCE